MQRAFRILASLVAIVATLQASAPAVSAISSWEQRQIEFEKIKAATKTPREVREAIRILRAELDYAEKRSDVASESYGAYLSDLVEYVAATGDPSSLPVLLTPLILHSGNIAIRGIANIGPPAFNRVVRELQRSRDPDTRQSLAMVLQKMFQQFKFSENDYDTARRALAMLLNDSEWIVRAASLDAYFAIGAEKDMAVIRRAAEQDNIRKVVDGSARFRVREHARELLAKKAN